MHKLSELIKSREVQGDYRNKQEFQAYGNRLAEELGDIKHRSLYIKLAKTENRVLLEKARDAAISSNVTTKGKIFMWKLSELKKALKDEQK
jgi:Zn-finger domain-containing protein